MPTTTATFKQYLSSLVVTLYTEQKCDSTHSASVTGYQLDDVQDDDAWSPRPSRQPRTLVRALHQTHRANVSITIEPMTRQTLMSTLRTSSSTDGTFHPGPPTHYMATGAEAPLVYAYQAATGVLGDRLVQEVTFKPLSHVVVRETEDQLIASRYDRHDGMEPWRNDGHRNHVGQVWARKAQREKEAAEALGHEQARSTQDGALQSLKFQVD